MMKITVINNERKHKRYTREGLMVSSSAQKQDAPFMPTTLYRDHREDAIRNQRRRCWPRDEGSLKWDLNAIEAA
ncbi:MAG: hypothetical protein IJK42_10515 [Prevotella sp.]|nr:hypothetical protein [Prevotella sp.]